MTESRLQDDQNNFMNTEEIELDDCRDITNFLIIVFNLKRLKKRMKEEYDAEISGEIKFTLDGLERTVKL